VDRKLVDAQKLCRSADRLGRWAPVKVILDGKAVFLCCKGCEEEAREHPEQTLAAVEKLKEKEKADASGLIHTERPGVWGRAGRGAFGSR
jgi:hypothetical protein